MKKRKTNLKKLTLNKNVVSKLEQSQVNGGTVITLACPVTLFCPTNFCPTKFNCPTLNLIECGTIKTLDGPGCGGSLIDGCQTALGCF